MVQVVEEAEMVLAVGAKVIPLFIVKAPLKEKSVLAPGWVAGVAATVKL